MMLPTPLSFSATTRGLGPFGRRLRWVPRANAMLFAIVAIGCVSIQTTGQSTNGMIANMKRSATFVHADIYYPDGQVLQPSLVVAGLSGRDMRRLGAELGEVRDFVLEAHEVFYYDMAEYFGREVVAEPELKLRLQTRNEARLNVGPSDEIVIDTRVVYGLFRSSLASELGGSGLGDDDDRDAELIEEFLRLKQDVENADGRTLLGDISDADSDRIWGVVDMSETTFMVDTTYRAVLRFGIAHELGHVVLDHYARVSVECQSALELEADEYAAYLTTRAAIPRLVRFQIEHGGWDLPATMEMLAPAKFFAYGYQRAGFRTPSRGSDQCGPAYPPAEKRADAAVDAVNNVWERYALPTAMVLLKLRQDRFERGLRADLAEARGIDDDEAAVVLYETVLTLRQRGLTEEQAYKEVARACCED